MNEDGGAVHDGEEIVMSWIRLELQVGSDGSRSRYDGICEEANDLGAEVAAGYAEYNGSHIKLANGSGAFCLETGKLYFKKADRSWGDTAPEAAAQEEET